MVASVWFSRSILTFSFASSSQTWNSFHVGTFRRTESGLAVAESLTDVDLAWPSGDSEAFVELPALPLTPSGKIDRKALLV